MKDLDLSMHGINFLFLSLLLHGYGSVISHLLSAMLCREYTYVSKKIGGNMQPFVLLKILGILIGCM